MRSVLIFVLLLWWSSSSCTKPPDTSKPKTTADRNAERESNTLKSRQVAIDKESAEIGNRVQAHQEIRDITARHNAVLDWGKELRTPKQLFTSNFQEVLVRADSRPVLLFAQISDIRKEGDKYFIEFEADMYDQEIHFTLECTADKVRVVRSDTSSSYDHYALVAAVSSVRRPRFAVQAAPQTADEAEVELDASAILLATGTCIDIVNIGND